MVVSRSSSSGAPVRANLRKRLSAILMLRMPSSTLPSRSRNSRLSHTLTARLLLFLQALAQRLHELVPAHRLDLLLLFLGEVFLRELLQPFGRNVRLLHGVQQAFQPLEHGAEHAVELVEITLVLY